MGEPDAIIQRPIQGGYDVHVPDAEPIVRDAERRIQQAAATYHLSHNTTVRLLEQFQAGATYRFPQE